MIQKGAFLAVIGRKMRRRAATPPQRRLVQILENSPTAKILKLDRPARLVKTGSMSDRLESSARIPPSAFAASRTSRLGTRRFLRFGARVREARELRNWTLREVAERLDCSPQAVQAIESGRNLPKNYARLCALYGLSPGGLGVLIGEDLAS